MAHGNSFAGPRSIASADESEDLAEGDAQAFTGQAQQTIQRLTHHISRLKASRDKLLGQVDGHSAEVERLCVSNASLEQVRHAPAASAGRDS